MNICLVLTVKNESHNIIHYLQSNKSKFNMISVLDIKSTDNTIELIQEWCLKTNISLAIHKSNQMVPGDICIELAKLSYPNVNKYIIVDT